MRNNRVLAKMTWRALRSLTTTGLRTSRMLRAVRSLLRVALFAACVLLLIASCSAQNECSLIDNNEVVLQTTRDSNNVLHQTMCANVTNGTVSYPLASVHTGTNPGYWQNDKTTSYISENLNNCPIAADFNLTNGGNFTSAITGAACPPTPPKSILQANGLFGLAEATDNTNSVGVSGVGIARPAALYSLANISCSSNVVTFNTIFVPQISTGTLVYITGVTGNTTVNTASPISLTSGTNNTTGPFTFNQTCTNGSGTGGNMQTPPKAWGTNCVVQSISSSVPFPIIQCIEADLNPDNPNVVGSGIDINGAYAFDWNGGTGISVNGGNANTGRLLDGINFNAHCCINGINMGPSNFGNGQQSLAIQMQATNAGGTIVGNNILGNIVGGFTTQANDGSQTQFNPAFHMNSSSSNNDRSGKLTCSASTITKTFATPYTSTPTVLVFDETNKGGVNLTAISPSAFTASCTGATDSLDYLVLGNPN